MFGEGLATEFLGCARERDWASIDRQMLKFRRALRRNAVRRDPLNLVRFWKPEVARLRNRWLHPIGLFLEVLGPDGAGKSALSEGVAKLLVAPSYRRLRTFHLRPRALRPTAAPGPPVLNPHGSRPRSYLASVVKLGFYVADYFFGYLIKVRPSLVRDNVVLADRYYDDLLVDHRRYRYRGPTSILKWCQRLVPKPDLLLVLDAPEDVLLARKREISRLEVSGQRRAYRELVGEQSNAFVVDASQPPEVVARDVTAICLDFMADRYVSRRGSKLPSTWDLDLRWLGGVLLNPQRARFATNQAKTNGTWRTVGSRFLRASSATGGRYLFPTGPGAKRGFELYNAQRRRARVARAALSAATRTHWLSRMLPGVVVQVHADVSEAELSSTTIFEQLEQLFHDEELSFTISLGTPGLHRKPVLQISGSNRGTIGYLKIATDSANEWLVRNEVDTLRNLEGLQPRTFKLPSLLRTGLWRGRPYCLQSAPQGPSRKAPARFSAEYLDMVMELSALNRSAVRWESSRFWNDTISAMSAVPNPYYRHLMEEAAASVNTRLGCRELPFHFCHGDFAPWNAKQSQGDLFLFDWECADELGPPGWDLFNFITEKELLLEKATPNQVLRQILSSRDTGQWLSTYFRSLAIGEEFHKALYLAYLVP